MPHKDNNTERKSMVIINSRYYRGGGVIRVVGVATDRLVAEDVSALPTCVANTLWRQSQNEDSHERQTHTPQQSQQTVFIIKPETGIPRREADKSGSKRRTDVIGHVNQSGKLDFDESTTLLSPLIVNPCTQFRGKHSTARRCTNDNPLAAH